LIRPVGRRYCRPRSRRSRADRTERRAGLRRAADRISTGDPRGRCAAPRVRRSSSDLCSGRRRLGLGIGGTTVRRTCTARTARACNIIILYRAALLWRCLESRRRARYSVVNDAQRSARARARYDGVVADRWRARTVSAERFSCVLVSVRLDLSPNANRAGFFTPKVLHTPIVYYVRHVVVLPPYTWRVGRPDTVARSHGDFALFHSGSLRRARVDNTAGVARRASVRSCASRRNVSRVTRSSPVRGVPPPTNPVHPLVLRCTHAPRKTITKSRREITISDFEPKRLVGRVSLFIIELAVSSVWHSTNYRLVSFLLVNFLNYKCISV